MKKSNTNTFLRSDENWDKYQQEPRRDSDDCLFCNRETIECFTHWYICVNDYPYDTVAEVHHMLVPIDHVSHETELSISARRELEMIFGLLNQEEKYDSIMRNFSIGQSQPMHLHYHLLTWKRR